MPNRLAPAPTRSSAFTTWTACLMVLFLVLFPKGGIRLLFFPMTWGYLLLMLTIPVAAAVRLLAMPLVIAPRALAAVGLLLPFQALYLYTGYCNGIAAIDFAFSNFVGLFVLPWSFVVIFAPFYPFIDGERLTRWFRNCIFLAAVWGLLLFVLHPLTGKFLEIPYLTVNASDYGHLEGTKSISRGFFYKLISTYNNGNIYGVATLLLFPLYSRLEPSRLRRGTVQLALFLTLSRTVWVGIVLNQVLSLFPPLFRQIKTFPVLYLGEARRRFLAVLVTMLLVVASVFLITLNGSALNFLFDKSLGNRAGEITVASHPTFFPEQPLGGFQEVLYASAAEFMGITGLFAFSLIMFSPLLIACWTPEVMQHPLRRAALKGLLLYIVLAASDGALGFIPVMAFYWFVYAVFLYDWPGRSSLARVKAGSVPWPVRALRPSDALH